LVVQRAGGTAPNHLRDVIGTGLVWLDPWPGVDVEYGRQAADALGEVAAPAAVVENGDPDRRICLARR
jgi:hypothetical protein